MGVKDLWAILEPVKQPMSLYELRGLTIAIDLSIWIVEAKTLQLRGVNKPHLRNIFFRVSSLLHLDIIPVIVVEGTPPDLKQEVMRKRLAAQSNRVFHTANVTSSKKLTRNNFSSVNRECCELLDYLGVPYVQSAGEAEAMCAFLNRHGLVDGCITNDGDAFLYGATTVYRNFTTNSKDPHVEGYRMDDIMDRLKLNRERLVGLGIMLGCDYLPKGVPGVGREQVMKLVATLNHKESLLGRFEAWVNGSCSMEDCSPAEWAVCKKAMATPGFPFKDVAQEFLVDRDRLPATSLVWKRPKMFHFMNFARMKMEWPDNYGIEKALPLITRFDMKNHCLLSANHSLQPHRIVKTRVKQGVNCLEVEWKKMDGDCVTIGDYYVTIEEHHLFVVAFPDVVAEFQMNVNAKKPKKSKKKACPSIEGSCDLDSGSAAVDDYCTQSSCHLPSPVAVKNLPSARRRSKSCSSHEVISRQRQLSVNQFFDQSILVRYSSDESLPSASSLLPAPRQRCTGSGSTNIASQLELGDRSYSEEEEEELLPLFERLALNVEKSDSCRIITSVDGQRDNYLKDIFEVDTERKREEEYGWHSSSESSVGVPYSSGTEIERRVLSCTSFKSDASISDSSKVKESQHLHVGTDVGLEVASLQKTETEAERHASSDIGCHTDKDKIVEIYSVCAIGSGNNNACRGSVDLKKGASSVMSDDVFNDVIVLDDSIVDDCNLEAVTKINLNEIIDDEMTVRDAKCCAKSDSEFQRFSNSVGSSAVACSSSSGKERCDFSSFDGSCNYVCSSRNTKDRGHPGTSSIQCTKEGLEINGGSRVVKSGIKHVKLRRAILKQRVKSILSDDVFNDFDVSCTAYSKKCGHVDQNSTAVTGCCEEEDKRSFNSVFSISSNSIADVDFESGAAFVAKHVKSKKVRSGSSLESSGLGCVSKQRRERLKMRVAGILSADVLNDTAEGEFNPEIAMKTKCSSVSDKENITVGKNDAEDERHPASRDQPSKDAKAKSRTLSEPNMLENSHLDPSKVTCDSSETPVYGHNSLVSYPTPWSARHIGNFKLETSIVQD